MDKVGGWGSVQNFDLALISIYDTSKLKPGIDINQWSENLKKLRWFGPYKERQDSETLFFKARSSSEDKSGFYLYFHLKKLEVSLGFKDSDNNDCGERYDF